MYGYNGFIIFDFFIKFFYRHSVKINRRYLKLPLEYYYQVFFRRAQIQNILAIFKLFISLRGGDFVTDAPLGLFGENCTEFSEALNRNYD